MPEFTRTKVGLRIFGETLDPDEITGLLGMEPTSCSRKGAIRRLSSGREVVARSGSWQLDAHAPGNLATRIEALLAQLPNDLSLWRGLSKRFQCDVFCGLFMWEHNEGTDLPPRILSMIGDRGLRLGLDVYNSTK